MDKELLNERLCEVFAAFQKRPPAPNVVEAVWYQVREYPDDFLEWAAARLLDNDRLPQNIGREMRKGLYPEWQGMQLARHLEEMQEGTEGMGSGNPACQDCGGDGWFYVWRPDARAGTAATAIPCTCCWTVEAIFPDAKVRKFTRQQVLEAGWTFNEPPMIRNRPPTPLTREQVRARIEAALAQEAEENRPAPEDVIPASAPVIPDFDDYRNHF
ncbi:MAG: hypothetical protein K6E40_17970 [Desulfovibrio sp.]|nr:hypothetical protein [Desulfovibrio sp.]